MSADNAIFVQKNKADKFVAQHGFMSSDELPDPETAREEDIFRNLDDLITKMAPEAADTEYGFKFFLKNPEEQNGTIVYDDKDGFHFRKES